MSPGRWPERPRTRHSTTENSAGRTHSPRRTCPRPPPVGCSGARRRWGRATPATVRIPPGRTARTAATRAHRTRRPPLASSRTAKHPVADPTRATGKPRPHHRIRTRRPSRRARTRHRLRTPPPRPRPRRRTNSPRDSPRKPVRSPPDSRRRRNPVRSRPPVLRRHRRRRRIRCHPPSQAPPPPIQPSLRIRTRGLRTRSGPRRTHWRISSHRQRPRIRSSRRRAPRIRSRWSRPIPVGRSRRIRSRTMEHKPRPAIRRPTPSVHRKPRRHRGRTTSPPRPIRPPCRSRSHHRRPPV